MYTGGRTPSGQNTLSAEEMQIATASRPDLSRHAAGLEYLKNKKRMLEMKADGRIQGDG